MLAYITSEITRFRKLSQRATLFALFDLHRLTRNKPSHLLAIMAVTWLLEWLILIEYTFDEWARVYLLQAIRVPVLLAVCLLYWFWLWSMAVWRRTQYGKFTRGERKLWAKAITAFWVAELVTAGSFFIIYVWVSWGPTPLVYRAFPISRKGLILEFVVFSYVLFFAHAAKYLIKWNGWRTQLTLCCVIMCLLSYIFWKDLMLLIMRENLYLPATARWRNIRTNLVVYTLSADWWSQHATTHRAAYALYDSLLPALMSGSKPSLNTLPILSQYNTNNTILAIHKSPRAAAAFPVLNYIFDYSAQYDPSLQYVQPNAAYPRRTGFVPKRLAMWQLLMILKMYHHILLLIWWTLYVFRLLFRKKTSYSFLNSCVFNIYCCFVLAGLIYILYILPRAELILKVKPQHLDLHHVIIRIHGGWQYLGRTLIHWNQRNATPHFPIL